MKQRESINHNTVQPRGGRFPTVFSSVLLALSLGFGSSLLSGCLAVPAVMVTSATVTAAGVASEGERLVLGPATQGTENCAVAKSDGDGGIRPAEACQRQGTPPAQEESGDQELPKTDNHGSTSPNELESVG